MTENQEKLLLKDLSSRLPYGVKLQISSWDDEKMEYVDKADTLYSISSDNHVRTSSEDRDFYIDEVKPYLFPMSSMTEEQRAEYESLCIKETSEYSDLYGIIFAKDHYYDTIESIDYLYKNHIDVRGFIPNGLAIDATGLGIY